VIGHKTKCTCALCDDATLRRASSALYDIADAMAARASLRFGHVHSERDGMHLMIAASAIISDAFGLDQDEWTEMCDKFWTVATGSTGET
jgi:hypothetical protein